MRVYLKKEYCDDYGWIGSVVLTPDNWYEGELAPTIYDPTTYEPGSESYVVKCNDGKLRIVDGIYLITEEEWRDIRDQKLNDLGII